jgi:hypothetical protein
MLTCEEEKVRSIGQLIFEDVRLCNDDVPLTAILFGLGLEVADRTRHRKATRQHSTGIGYTVHRHILIDNASCLSDSLLLGRLTGLMIVRKLDD